MERSKNQSKLQRCHNLRLAMLLCVYGSLRTILHSDKNINRRVEQCRIIGASAYSTHPLNIYGMVANWKPMTASMASKVWDLCLKTSKMLPLPQAGLSPWMLQLGEFSSLHLMCFPLPSQRFPKVFRRLDWKRAHYLYSQHPPLLVGCREGPINKEKN